MIKYLCLIRYLIIIPVILSLISCGVALTVAMQYSEEFEKKKDPLNTSRIQGSYRIQKKYDLLEKNLLKRRGYYIKNKWVFGQLYTALDLAEFYTYGFIDYRKSLEFYLEADALNKRINDNKLICDQKQVSKPVYRQREPNSIFKKVEYYTSSGGRPKKRVYNYTEISSRITKGRQKIQRALGAADMIASDDVLPKIDTLITNQYSFAIQVGKDKLNPKIFDTFDKKLLDVTKEYFKYRHKIPNDEKDGYIYFNVLRCLIDTFDISGLSISRTGRLLSYIEKAAIKDSSKTDDSLRKLYLNFARTLCLSKLGRHQEAVEAYHIFQSDIESVNKKLSEYVESMKQSRIETAKYTATNAILQITMMTLSLSSKSSDIDVMFDAVENVSKAIIPQTLISTILSLNRRIKFIGESDYAHGMKVIINENDQLQLFKALGISYDHIGNTEKSIFYNKEAINIINNLRSTITREKDRITFARFKDEIYNRLIDALIANNENLEALFFAENARSRAFVDLLGSRKDIAFKNENINQYINELRNAQTYRDHTAKQTGITDEQAEHINRGLNTVTEKMVFQDQNSGKTNSLPTTQERKTDHREVLSLVTVKNLRVEEMQTLIPPNYTLVEYYISDKYIYAWVMDREHVHTYTLDISPEIEKITSSLYNPSLVNFEDIIKIGSKCYISLFSPIVESIRHKQVFIVGHRFLHSIPFEMLHNGNEFLVQRYRFSYIPSASVLQFLKPYTGPKKTLLALGNPEIQYNKNLVTLDGAEKEVIQIADTFPLKKICLNEKASETLFRNEAKYYQTIHVACHGKFDSIHPLNSKLFLSRDEQNDGLLLAKDLYGMQLNARLVTLSACQTAMSEVETGDELLGLVRGFFFAGTSNLVASLWKVNDIATEKMMVKFYTYLQAGETIATSLQQAKIEMMNTKKYNHPFFWAAFNLFGLGF